MSDVIDNVVVDEMVLDMDKVDFFSLEDTNISVKETTKVGQTVAAKAEAKALPNTAAVK